MLKRRRDKRLTGGIRPHHFLLETCPSTTLSRVATLENNQIVSGSYSDNTLSLVKAGGGSVDIPFEAQTPVVINTGGYTKCSFMVNQDISPVDIQNVGNLTYVMELYREIPEDLYFATNASKCLVNSSSAMSHTSVPYFMTRTGYRSQSRQVSLDLSSTISADALPDGSYEIAIGMVTTRISSTGFDADRGAISGLEQYGILTKEQSSANLKCDINLNNFASGNNMSRAGYINSVTIWYNQIRAIL